MLPRAAFHCCGNFRLKLGIRHLAVKSCCEIVLSSGRNPPLKLGLSHVPETTILVSLPVGKTVRFREPRISKFISNSFLVDLPDKSTSATMVCSKSEIGRAHV